MHRRLRGVIGATATPIALVAIGVVVSYQPAGAGPRHGSHPGAVDQQQAQAIKDQVGVLGVSEFRVACGRAQRMSNVPRRLHERLGRERAPTPDDQLRQPRPQVRHRREPRLAR
jgi:hypothetical protein